MLGPRVLRLLLLLPELFLELLEDLSWWLDILAGEGEEGMRWGG